MKAFGGRRTSRTKKLRSTDEGSVGPLETVLETKLSKRTLLKGTLAVGAVVGVSAVALASERPALAETSVTSSQQAVTVDPFALQSVTFTVNGLSQTVFVEPRETLALVLRETLGLVGTKIACNRMSCGACTVLIDGAPHESCQYLAVWAAGKNILTTEAGVASSTTGPAADPVVAALQSAWLEKDGGQCCFCSPGNIMAATALLKANPNPSVDDIKTALSGNLCRCGNYLNIIASIQLAATNLGGA